MGYLDIDAMKCGLVQVTSPLEDAIFHRIVSKYADRYDCTTYILCGHAVTLRNGYVICPWLMPARIKEAERIAIELAQETGCLVVDAGCRQIIDPLQIGRDMPPAQLEALGRVVRGNLGIG